MRVQCKSVEEFLVNLKDESSEAVLRQTVHLSVTERMLDESPGCVRFGVTVQASCVVDFDDGNQYLLECGEECGVDYRDASKESEGTRRADELKAKLIEFCDDRGLKVRPGVVGP